jgi:TPR repeat protein
MELRSWLVRSLLGISFCVLAIETPMSAQSRYQEMTQQELAQTADMGDSNAQIVLGVDLLKGRWGRRQYKAANQQFRAAANNGSLDGEAWLGNSYLFGLGMAQNTDVGIQMIESAASKGDAVGVWLKGVMIDRSFVIASDPRQASDYYQLAANMNSPEACDAIGLAFLSGRGRPINIDTPARYFQRGAALGDDGSLLHLGQLYEAGKPFHDPTDKQILVGAPDFDKALQAYMKAANLGNRLAAYKAGMILNNEQIGLANKTKATAYFEQAARHQFAPARIALAQMLSTGTNGNQNRSRALALYDRAAEQGEARATQLAADLKSSMTQQEIRQAQIIETAIAARDHSYSQ